MVGGSKCTYNGPLSGAMSPQARRAPLCMQRSENGPKSGIFGFRARFCLNGRPGHRLGIAEFGPESLNIVTVRVTQLRRAAFPRLSPQGVVANSSAGTIPTFRYPALDDVHRVRPKGSNLLHLHQIPSGTSDLSSRS